MHNVGDILYVISNKKKNVIPVQVTQQITHRTLNKGEEVVYMVTLPKSGPSDTEKIVRLGSINGEVFYTLDEAREELFEQATEAINSVLNHAMEVEKENFHHNGLSDDHTYDDSPSEENELVSQGSDDEVFVAMPDGTEAKIRLPQELTL